jgi:hypothetical protein
MLVKDRYPNRTYSTTRIAAGPATDHTSHVSVRIAFEGGPADGTVQDYPRLGTALPSVYWSREEPQHISAVYRRLTDAPDPTTGIWRYSIVG